MPEIFGPKYHLENNAFSMQLLRRKGYTSMAMPHAHNFYEIYYLRKGERIYFINGKVYTVKSGDIIVINPQDVHRTTSSEIPEFERILINFTHDFIQPGILSADVPLLPFQHGSQLIRLPVGEQPNTEQLIFEMLRECQNKEVGHTYYVKALLLKLLIQIYRQSFQVPPESVHPMHEKISEIATYIEQHYQEKITLLRMADLFYISPSYLSRTFKKITGFYFTEYVQAVRMREARRQLIESEEKILAISANVGFHTVAHFNKIFKSLTGVSPLQYRKNNSHLSFEEQKLFAD